MLVNPTYNSATSVFYALKEQGYRFSNLDMFNCDVTDTIKETYFHITTPRGTSCLIRHAQFISINGEFMDTFHVCAVHLPSGEYCRGKMYCADRWNMLMKAAEKRSNCSYEEYAA